MGHLYGKQTELDYKSLPKQRRHFVEKAKVPITSCLVI